MKGKITAVVLGAGVSFCYEDGHINIPMQHDIVGRLFHGADTSSGAGFPSFTGTHGPTHSFQLGQYLRQKYSLPEDPSKESAKLDFWTALQERGHNLETFYAELEDTLEPENKHLLEEFEAIVRTAVTAPVGDREKSNVCRYHRNICESLEPGDYIIDFNWDSLMADALLHESHFWFPATGFGQPVFQLNRPGQKSLPISSLVHLFQIHGSVTLYEFYDDSDHQDLLFLGPKQHSPMDSILQIQGIDLSVQKGKSMNIPMPKDVSHRIFQLGHLYINGKWLKPLFIPPSSEKGDYNHWYFRQLRRQIHQRLPSTQNIIIAGYSFPPADVNHLGSIFVRDVLDPNLQIQVINMSNEDLAFQSSVKAVFPDVSIDYSIKDFKEFAMSLETQSSSS